MNTHIHTKPPNEIQKEVCPLSEHECVSSGSEEVIKEKFGWECPKILLGICERTTSCNRGSCQPVLNGTQNALWFSSDCSRKGDQGFIWEFAFYRQTKVLAPLQKSIP